MYQGESLREPNYHIWPMLKRFDGFGDRAKLDGNARLLDFTEKLEAACIGTVESGKMTKDLALLIHGSRYSLTHLVILLESQLSS